MTKREAVIEGSEVHILQSELTGKTYRLSVALPYDYHDEPDKKWPVVYHLDGNTYFGMITEIVRSMAWCGMTRDAIVAGIGYATGTIMREAWHDRLTMRMHDLTPDRDRERENRAMEEWNGEVISGGGAQFLEFLTTDVLPLVENRYRVDQQERTLAGHSLGGLFPLYAMFQNPAKFKTHVACSPSIYWNGQIMLEIEKAYADAHDSLPARLFLSMGELEMEGGISYDGMLRLFDQLQRRDYKDIEIEMKLFPDDDHCTVLAPSLAAGLKFALRSDQPT